MDNISLIIVLLADGLSIASVASSTTTRKGLLFDEKSQ
jgi:hypothetical protein